MAVGIFYMGWSPGEFWSSTRLFWRMLLMCLVAALRGLEGSSLLRPPAPTTTTTYIATLLLLPLEQLLLAVLLLVYSAGLPATTSTALPNPDAT